MLRKRLDRFAWAMLCPRSVQMRSTALLYTIEDMVIKLDGKQQHYSIVVCLLWPHLQNHDFLYKTLLQGWGGGSDHLDGHISCAMQQSKVHLHAQWQF